jgi:predicted O-methyltransferase YrrM
VPWFLSLRQFWSPRLVTVQPSAEFPSRYALAVGPLGNAAEYAADYVTEDGPLLTARANATDLGGTEPVRPAVGAALRFIACAVGARTAVEVGTGCGSSGIWLLRGMRPGGTLTSVDTEPEYHRMTRQVFTQAGFAANQSRLILGLALDVLPRLSDGAYDMVFCDIDPAGYPDYLTAALRLLRPGGVVAFNNVLLSGSDSGSDSGSGSGFGAAGHPGSSGGEYYGGFAGYADEVAEQSSADLDVAGMVRDDERLVPMLLPLGDGLLAAVKR